MNTDNKTTAKKITLTCPNDKHKFAITCPEKPGGYMAQCPKCGKKYKVSISQELLDKLSGGDKVTSSDANPPRNETKLVGATKPMSLGGKLVLLRKLWKNKEKLHFQSYLKAANNPRTLIVSSTLSDC